MNDDLSTAAQLARYFEAGGWPMYPLVLVLMLAVLASLALPIVTFVTQKPRLAMLFAMILAAIGLLAAGLGAMGQQIGLHTVEEAIVHVNPVDREVIRWAGSSECRVCLAFGLFIAVLPLFAAGLALGRAFSSKESSLATLGGVALALGLGVVVGAAAMQQSSIITMEEAHASVRLNEGSDALANAAQAEASRRIAFGITISGPFILCGAMLMAVGASRGKPKTSG